MCLWLHLWYIFVILLAIHDISVHFFIISPLSFRAKNNLDHWYQSRLLLIIFQCIYPTRSEYRNLGLDIISLEENFSLTPNKPSTVEENKNDRVDDSINLLLERSLMRQRDKMMENFSHILQRVSIETRAYSSNNHFGSTFPFKVQVNFDILVFEG